MKTSLVVLSLFFTCLAAAPQPKDVDLGESLCQNQIKFYRIMKKMQDQIKNAEVQIAKLKNDAKASQVAFGAAFGGTQNFGPFPADRKLTFKKVFFNSGSFNPSTGIFTAPFKGVYYFSFSGHNHSDKPMGLRLMKNDERITLVYNHVAKNNAVPLQTGSSAATLQLKKGDRVYLRLLAHTWVYDNESQHTVFNGALLYRL